MNNEQAWVETLMPPLVWRLVDASGGVFQTKTPLGIYTVAWGVTRTQPRADGPTWRLGGRQGVDTDGVSAHYEAVRTAVAQGQLGWLDRDGLQIAGCPSIPATGMFPPLYWTDNTAVGAETVYRSVCAETPLGHYQVRYIGDGETLATGPTLPYHQLVLGRQEGMAFIEEHYVQVRKEVLSGKRALLLGQNGVWYEGDQPLRKDEAASKGTNWLEEARRNYAVIDDLSEAGEMRLAFRQAQTAALISIAESLETLRNNSASMAESLESAEAHLDLDFMVKLYGGSS